MDDMDFRLPDAFQETLVVLYLISSCVSFVGNITLITLILLKRSLRTSSNYLLLCIAFGEILLLASCVPFTVLSNLVQYQWTFGATMCSFVGYIQAAIVIQRALLLSASAIDQHRVFRVPFRKRLTVKTTLKIIALVWTFSLLLSIPVAKFSTIVINSEQNATVYCFEIWNYESGKHIYNVSLMVVTYVFPVAVLIFTKVDVASIMFAKNPPGEDHENHLIQRRIQKKKTLANFLIVVAAYAICWLPLHVITIIIDFKLDVLDASLVRLLWLLSHWLAMSNSAINPVIVLAKQEKFRTQIRIILDTFRKDVNRRGKGYVRSAHSSFNSRRGSTFTSLV